MTPCQPSDRGSGTVLVVGGIGLLVTAVVLLALVGSLLVSSARAASAADLAALAAARELLAGNPCAAAGRVATTNSSELTQCEVHADGSVTVRVAVTVGGRIGRATAVARAGLAP